MTHIAIAEQQDGKAVDWMEKVSDEQYGAPATPAAPALSVPGASGQTTRLEH